ncbi:MAG: hypothetical protein ACOCRO_06210 [Halanaerobiales bacterium]
MLELKEKDLMEINGGDGSVEIEFDYNENDGASATIRFKWEF